MPEPKHGVDLEFTPDELAEMGAEMRPTSDGGAAKPAKSGRSSRSRRRAASSRPVAPPVPSPSDLVVERAFRDGSTLERSQRRADEPAAAPGAGEAPAVVARDFGKTTQGYAMVLSEDLDDSDGDDQPSQQAGGLAVIEPQEPASQVEDVPVVDEAEPGREAHADGAEEGGEVGAAADGAEAVEEGRPAPTAGGDAAAAGSPALTSEEAVEERTFERTIKGYAATDDLEEPDDDAQTEPGLGEPLRVVPAEPDGTAAASPAADTPTALAATEAADGMVPEAGAHGDTITLDVSDVIEDQVDGGLGAEAAAAPQLAAVETTEPVSAPEEEAEAGISDSEVEAGERRGGSAAGFRQADTDPELEVGREAPAEAGAALAVAASFGAVPHAHGDQADDSDEEAEELTGADVMVISEEPVAPVSGTIETRGVEADAEAEELSGADVVVISEEPVVASGEVADSAGEEAETELSAADLEEIPVDVTGVEESGGALEGHPGETTGSARAPGAVTAAADSHDDEGEELSGADLEEITVETAAAPPPTPPVAEATSPPPAPSPAEGSAPPPAPAAEDEAKPPRRRRQRPWFEEVFDEDYLRTLPNLTAAQTRREVALIEESLGLSGSMQVLDVACGYGRHAMELAARGYRVTGIDLSLGLLIRAADEAQRRGLHVNFVHGDMRDLNFDEPFDAIYSVGTSFGYFDEEANRKMIQGVARVLKPSGRFFLEVVNRDYVVSGLPTRVWWEGDGCVVLEEVDFDYYRSRLTVRRSVVFEDGRQLEHDISIRVYSLHELGRVLQSAGLRVLEVSGHTTTKGRFFGASSRALLVLAERRSGSGAA